MSEMTMGEGAEDCPPRTARRPPLPRGVYSNTPTNVPKWQKRQFRPLTPRRMKGALRGFLLAQNPVRRRLRGRLLVELHDLGREARDGFTVTANVTAECSFRGHGDDLGPATFNSADCSDALQKC